MGLFRRKGSAGKPDRPGTTRTAGPADRDHLTEFAESHSGVEGYLEPQTTVTECTLMLVDAEGEWTRRRVPSPDHAQSLAKKLGIPLYDAVKVGYPQRKRDFDARRAAERRSADGS